MDFLFDESSSKTFKRKRNIPEGTHQYDLKKYVAVKVKKTELRLAVKLPKDENLNEWVAVHTIAFYNQINALYGTIVEFCTNESCPVMSAGNFEYHWLSEQPITKKRTAPEHIDYIMTWIQRTLNYEDLFPSKPGTIAEIEKREYLQRCQSNQKYYEIKEKLEERMALSKSRKFKTFNSPSIKEKNFEVIKCETMDYFQEMEETLEEFKSDINFFVETSTISASIPSKEQDDKFKEISTPSEHKIRQLAETCDKEISEEVSTHDEPTSSESSSSDEEKHVYSDQDTHKKVSNLCIEKLTHDKTLTARVEKSSTKEYSSVHAQSDKNEDVLNLCTESSPDEAQHTDTESNFVEAPCLYKGTTSGNETSSSEETASYEIQDVYEEPLTIYEELLHSFAKVHAYEESLSSDDDEEPFDECKEFFSLAKKALDAQHDEELSTTDEEFTSTYVEPPSIEKVPKIIYFQKLCETSKYYDDVQKDINTIMKRFYKVKTLYAFCAKYGKVVYTGQGEKTKGYTPTPVKPRLSSGISAISLGEIDLNKYFYRSFRHNISDETPKPSDIVPLYVVPEKVNTSTEQTSFSITDEGISDLTDPASNTVREASNSAYVLEKVSCNRQAETTSAIRSYSSTAPAAKDSGKLPIKNAFQATRREVSSIFRRYSEDIRGTDAFDILGTDSVNISEKTIVIDYDRLDENDGHVVVTFLNQFLASNYKLLTLMSSLIRIVGFKWSANEENFVEKDTYLAAERRVNKILLHNKIVYYIILSRMLDKVLHINEDFSDVVIERETIDLDELHSFKKALTNIAHNIMLSTDSPDECEKRLRAIDDIVFEMQVQAEDYFFNFVLLKSEFTFQKDLFSSAKEHDDEVKSTDISCVTEELVSQVVKKYKTVPVAKEGLSHFVDNLVCSVGEEKSSYRADDFVSRSESDEDLPSLINKIICCIEEKEDKRRSFCIINDLISRIQRRENISCAPTELISRVVKECTCNVNEDISYLVDKLISRVSKFDISDELTYEEGEDLFYISRELFSGVAEEFEVGPYFALNKVRKHISSLVYHKIYDLHEKHKFKKREHEFKQRDHFIKETLKNIVQYVRSFYRNRTGDQDSNVTEKHIFKLLEQKCSDINEGNALNNEEKLMPDELMQNIIEEDKYNTVPASNRHNIPESHVVAKKFKYNMSQQHKCTNTIGIKDYIQNVAGTPMRSLDEWNINVTGRFTEAGEDFSDQSVERHSSSKQQFPSTLAEYGSDRDKLPVSEKNAYYLLEEHFPQISKTKVDDPTAIEQDEKDEICTSRKLSVLFPENFLSIVKSVLQPLLTIYAHIYHHHLPDIVKMGKEVNFNYSLKHFLFFVLEFNLVDKPDLSPFRKIIKSLSSKDNKRSAQKSSTKRNSLPV